MRNKLIELIADARNEYYDYSDELHEKGMSVPESSEEYIADYLLANGVVVPPCKVGQTIYYHFQFRNKSILPFTRKAKVKKIFCNTTKMKFVIEAEKINAKEKGIMTFFDFDDFGKTVFLTKEDAERALRKDESK